MIALFMGSTNLMNFFVKKNIQSFVQVGSSAEYGLTSSPQKEMTNVNQLIFME